MFHMVLAMIILYNIHFYVCLLFAIFCSKVILRLINSVWPEILPKMAAKVIAIAVYGAVLQWNTRSMDYYTCISLKPNEAVNA